MTKAYTCHQQNKSLPYFSFILNAGNETTANLIGNSLVTLLDWPDARAQLLAQPALIHSAVEEFLRFESSNQLGNRITTRENEVAGVTLAPQTRVHLCIGAANRDPAQFPDADRLDITREPNRHLAFGFGIHLCAALSLARLEGRIAVSRFLARFPRYRLAGAPVRGGRVRFRGVSVGAGGAKRVTAQPQFRFVRHCK